MQLGYNDFFRSSFQKMLLKMTAALLPRLEAEDGTGPNQVGLEPKDDGEGLGAATGHISCPLGRVKNTASGSLLAGPTCTWVCKLGITPFARIYWYYTTSYASVSCVKAVLRLLKTSVLAEKEDDTDLTKTIKVKILDYMNESMMTQEHAASFTDPRFKVSYISSKNVQDVRVTSEMKETAWKVIRYILLTWSLVAYKMSHAVGLDHGALSEYEWDVCFMYS